MNTHAAFKKHPLTLALHACCYSVLSAIPVAHAGPVGGEVVGGSGSITQSGLTTTITQASQNLAANWQSFDVNRNERVQFIQPNSTSIALNRILSNNGSTIAGQIDANGKVILVNPNGIFFTPTASLNVGSLIASGLDITPNDFMNGHYIFNEIPNSNGAVINSGMINAALGGNVTLLGKQVTNNGLIAATLGSVTLAAGKQAVLTFDNGGLLGVRISDAVLQKDIGVDPAVINNGTIQAQGGRVLLTASVSQDVFSRAVNNTGAEPATSVVVNADGSFTLGSGADVVNSGRIDTSVTNPNQNAGRIVLLGQNVTSSGTLNADARSGHGGDIELHAVDTTLLTQHSLTSARAETNGQGGVIKVLGDKVGLLDQSTVDVSGATAGGQALIGGDQQGQNPAIRNARFTYLSDQSQVNANGLDTGNGGKIITFASDTARVYGNLRARGGMNGGHGGLIETSGLKGFEILTAPDAGARQGRAGEWLIDPYNLTITGGSGRTSVTAGPDFSASSAGATLGTDQINTALRNNSSVTLYTGNSGKQNGDITVDGTANIDYAGAGVSALTFYANRNITFLAGSQLHDSSLTATNSLNVALNAGGAILIDPTASLVTQGGSFTVGSTNAPVASFMDRGVINTSSAGLAGGDVTLTASGAVDVGSINASGSALNTKGGTIAINAQNITLNGDINVSPGPTGFAGSANLTLNSPGAVTLNYANDFTSPITITGTGASTDTLNAANRTNNWTITGKNAGTLNPTATSGITFAQFGNLIGGAGDDTFTYQVDPSKAGLTIDGGAQIARDIVAIDPDATKYSGFTLDTSLFAHIERYQGNAGTNTLQGLGGNNVTNTWTITGSNSGTVNGIEFLDFPILAGNNGSNDNFTISGAGALTGTGAGIIGNVGSNSSITGPDGVNVWSVSQANTGSINATSFSNIQSLIGGNTTDTFTFSGTGSLSGLINGGGGTDTVSLIGLGGNVKVQLHNGTNPVLNTAAINTTNVEIINAAPANALTNTLIGDNTPNTWTLSGANSSGSVNSGNSNPIVSFSGFGNLTGGNQNDTFNYQPTATVAGTIDGGTGAGTTNTIDKSLMATVDITLGSQILNITDLIGNDTASTLTGDGNSNTWNITNRNSGSVAGMNFRGFNNLVGGSGNDTYNVSSNTGNTAYGYLTGTLTDTAGNNALKVDVTNVNAITGNETVTYIGNSVSNQDSVTVSGSAPSGWSGSYTPGTVTDQIAYTSATPGSSLTVNYRGVNTVSDTASVADYRISGTNGNDTFALGAANGANNVKINTKLISYDKKGNVILDGGLGADTLTQNSGDTLTLTNTGTGGLTLANLENINNGTALSTNIGTLGLINSGAVVVKEQNALTLGPITTTNAIDITAGGTVDSIAALVSTAPLTIRSTGDISLVGNNSTLSGPITLQQITSLSTPTLVAAPTNTITLNNTSATTLAGVNASNLYLTSTGNISDTGLVTVGNVIYLDTPGTITLKSMDHITTGTMKAAEITLNTVNGIGVVGINYKNPAQVLATTTSKLNVTNKSGNVFITNQGAVSTSIITQGDINFINNGNITVRQLNTDGGNQTAVSSQAGNIYLETVSGSAYGNPDPKVDYLVTPDIVAQNFTGFLNGSPRDMGQLGLPMSVLVKTLFKLYAENAYIHYFEPKPTDLQVQAKLFEYVDFSGLNKLLLNIESLGDFDPAIFTAVRNYNYEDVAIMMPADQRLNAPDEDENDHDKKKEEKKL